MNEPESRPSLSNTRLYPPLRGTRYIQYLKSIHIAVKPDCYFEIGSFTGDSLENSTTKTIAVDPNFQLSEKSIKGKPELHLFQMTSDNFFETDFSNGLVGQINLAFLDGMHLFEFLLRDFMQTEKRCAESATIVMHDCIPISLIAAERNRQTGAWTGDVWKLVPILKKYRPDLRIDVVNCPPSGLTIVRNLDPKNTVLDDNYEAIISDFMDQTIETFGPEKLYALLDIQSLPAAELFPNPETPAELE